MDLDEASSSSRRMKDSLFLIAMYMHIMRECSIGKLKMSFSFVFLSPILFPPHRSFLH